MALRSVLDIDVNDAAFKRYQDSFKKYQDLLAKTPAAWGKVTKEIDASRKSFNELVAAAAARQGYAKLTAEAESVAARQARSQADAWRDMARTTRTVAGNIVGATQALLKWAGVTTAISGLLGAGGLWGIDRLAISAAAQRRSSSGLGITPGENRAFGLNYGRLVDTGSVLAGVNAALTDPSQRGNLYKTGLSEADIQGKDAAQVSVLLINRLKTLADKYPKEMLGPLVANLGFGALGFTEQDARRERDRALGEFSGYERDFNRDRTGLDLSPGQQSAWERFKVQLERAGLEIETNFTRSLTDLTGPLGDLSKAFSGLIKTILGDDPAKNLIKGMAEGLKDFATFVGSKAFREDVQAFVKDIGLLAHGVHVALGWLFGDRGNPTGSPADQNPSFELDPQGGAQAQKSWDKFFDWLSKKLPDYNGGATLSPLGFHGGGLNAGLIYQIMFRSVAGGSPGGNGGGFPSLGPADNSANAKIVHDYFRAHGWTEVQTAGLLANAQAESDFDPHRVNRRGGDAGLFQWRGSRALQFAAFFGHPPQQGTLAEQLWFAQWELTEGPERAAGNQLRQVATAAQAGDVVTRAYERPDPNRIDIIAAQRAGLATRFYQQGVRILIQNNTGGSATVSASALSG